HAPAFPGDPGGISRLGHRGAVDQVVAAVDADHPAPGAHPDHWAHPECLRGGVDDVAVGTGVLIGHQHHRAARRVTGIGGGQILVPAGAPGHHTCGEFADHQLGGVSATVVTDIGD